MTMRNLVSTTPAREPRELQRGSMPTQSRPLEGWIVTHDSSYLLAALRLLGSTVMLARYFGSLARKTPCGASAGLIRLVRLQQVPRLLMLETVWR